MSSRPANDAPFRQIADVDFGENVTVWSFTNLFGCRIGDNTRIGSFVEIQRGAVIGAACKIQSHGAPKTEEDWTPLRTVVVTRDVAPEEIVAGVPARARWRE
jgi:carbonic anhydrase/acetyltransferase-like protein (isoleucine patch superfamily)